MSYCWRCNRWAAFSFSFVSESRYVCVLDMSASDSCVQPELCNDSGEATRNGKHGPLWFYYKTYQQNSTCLCLLQEMWRIRSAHRRQFLPRQAALFCNWQVHTVNQKFGHTYSFLIIAISFIFECLFLCFLIFEWKTIKQYKWKSDMYVVANKC